MEVVLKLLSDHGLRVNAEKSTFCADEIKYVVTYGRTKDPS
jgi:hypothetical protein